MGAQDMRVVQKTRASRVALAEAPQYGTAVKGPPGLVSKGLQRYCGLPRARRSAGARHVCVARAGYARRAEKWV